MACHMQYEDTCRLLCSLFEPLTLVLSRSHRPPPHTPCACRRAPSPGCLQCRGCPTLPTNPFPAFPILQRYGAASASAGAALLSGAGGGALMPQPAAELGIVEGQLTWLVHVVGSVIRGRLSSAAAECQARLNCDTTVVSRPGDRCGKGLFAHAGKLALELRSVVYCLHRCHGRFLLASCHAPVPSSVRTQLAPAAANRIV